MSRPVPDTCVDTPHIPRWGHVRPSGDFVYDVWSSPERMYECLTDVGQVHTVGFLHHRCDDLDADLWARPQGLIPDTTCGGQP